MALTKKSDQKIREKAIQLLIKGKSKKFISEKLDIDIATVYRWEKKFQSDKNWLMRGPRAGRNSKITDDLIDSLIKSLLVDPKKLGYEINLWNTSKIQNLIREQFILDVSQDLLIRLFNKINIKFKRPTNKMKKKVSSISSEIANQLINKKPVIYYEHTSKLDFSNVGTKIFKNKKLFYKLVISHSGLMFFRLYEDKINFEKSIDFWNELLKYHLNRNVLIVLIETHQHNKIEINKYLKKFERIGICELNSNLK
jgi:transposase